MFRWTRLLLLGFIAAVLVLGASSFLFLTNVYSDRPVTAELLPGEASSMLNATDG